MAMSVERSNGAHADAAGWSLARGATVVGDGAVRFDVWAPRARAVSVRLLDDDGAVVAEHPLDARDGGVHEATVSGVAPGADYQYVIDGGRALPDPVSRWQPRGVHGPSRVVDPRTFRWTDDGWRGPAMADYVIYELHVGTFSDEGTFDGAIPHLAGLAELGVTAIEIMPVAEFPGGRNWGYDGVALYAAQSTYGGPDALRRLVDAAHAAGLAVVLDVVYNHLGPEGNYLDAFGPYFTDVYRTPWGRAVNYDGPGSDEVRRFVIDNARYWVTEYHVDALRLDAVHGIYDFGVVHLLADLTEAVHAQAAALGRTVQLIAESDLNDPKVVRSRAEHGYGFDAQWSDDFHHAVHSALTGETSGYYADFGGVSPVAEVMRDPFLYGGRYSVHRGRQHGAAAAGVPRDRFVVCLQNHDQVGNRATGDRLAALILPDRQKLAAALLLLSPYVPLLFMGEEYGETNPFQYFVSHGDPALVDAVREGRRREFASFDWSADVPDPQDERTFQRSKLDRAKRRQPRHAALYAVYQDLLRLRRTEPALRPGGAEVEVEHVEGGGPIVVRLTPLRDPALGSPAAAARLVAAFNLSDTPAQVHLGGAAARHRVLFSTHDARYAASDGDPAFDGPSTTIDATTGMLMRPGDHVMVDAYGAVLLRQENL